MDRVKVNNLRVNKGIPGLLPETISDEMKKGCVVEEYFVWFKIIILININKFEIHCYPFCLHTGRRRGEQHESGKRNVSSSPMISL